MHSLKVSMFFLIRAIPLFYKIITDNQSTKLVYNLVYSSSKVQGPSPKHICPRTSAAGSIAGGDLGVTEAVGGSVMGFLVAGHRMRALGARTSVLAVMDHWSQCWVILLEAY